MTRDRGRDPRRLVFAALTALLVVAILEATLHLSALVSPRLETLLTPPEVADALARTVPDERLGYRPNPAFPGHDARGFRNPRVPARADVVALGDSQTYGAGVAPHQAWPRQLETILARPVYGMAYGGYGPAHSLLLWDEATAFAPEAIVAAIYSGNDLFDAFHLVYNRGQLAELKSPDPAIRERVRRAEETESIAAHVSRVFNLGRTRPPAARAGFSPRALLARRSKLYALYRRLRAELAAPRDPWQAATAAAAFHPAYRQVFDDGRFRTVFTAEYRLVALDLDDPRIAEGRAIALRALREMHRRAARDRIRLIVLLIPTKELVFGERWRDPPASYRELARHETVFWTSVKEDLERHGVEHLDALPALRARLARGVQPYPVTHDGHPNEHGHRAIAELVADRLTGDAPTLRTSGADERPSS